LEIEIRAVIEPKFHMHRRAAAPAFSCLPISSILARQLRSHLTALSRTARHRAMKRSCVCLASAIAVSLTSFSSSAAKQPLPRSTPEAQGISSEAIQDFVSTVEKINTLHSFMLLRHGQVVAEGWWKPEAPDKPHVLHSLAKVSTPRPLGWLSPKAN
jgi:hypothetical protein